MLASHYLSALKQIKRFFMLPVILSVLTTVLLLFTFTSKADESEALKSTYVAPHARVAPVIDGSPSESSWADAPWLPVNKVYIGSDLTPQDFSGRVKMVWRKEAIYLLAEIVDDVMSDRYSNPLEHYWDDEALEIFIDEDASGGNHQYNHSAFAYHVALDGQVVDSGPDEQPHLYNNHVTSAWKRQKDTTYWELKIKVYDERFSDSDNHARPVMLKKGKTLGFMVAYCDNDGGATRDHFIGTEEIQPVNGDKNRGWIDAGVFGRLVLGK